MDSVKTANTRKLIAEHLNVEVGEVIASDDRERNDPGYVRCSVNSTRALMHTLKLTELFAAYQWETFPVRAAS